MLFCPTRGKWRSLSQDAAIERAVKMTEKFQIPVEPYFCNCEGWHIRTSEKARVTDVVVARREAVKEATAGSPYLPWQDAYILAHPEDTNTAIGDVIGRGRNSVRNRRTKLREKGIS